MGKLTDRQVANAKPHTDGRPKRYVDGNNFYLLVKPTGKYWRYDYTHLGKRKTMALGVCSGAGGIGLADARRLHEDARNKVLKGIDPLEAKKQALLEAEKKNRNTFRVIALEWFENSKSEWSPSYTSRVHGILNRYVFPHIGERSISELMPRDILQLLQLMEKQVTETTKKAKQVCGQVFRYGVILGACDRDVTADLKGALKTHIPKSYAAITDPKQLGDLLRAIDNYSGTYQTRCALKVSALLMVRPTNIRHAEWSEFDLDNALWNIAPPKLKLTTPVKRANRAEDAETVPLPRQAVEILRGLYPLTGNGRYIFSSLLGGKRPMSENTVRTALRRMDFDRETMTAHGFRTTASTMLNEQGFNRDFVEKALFHKDGNKIRAIYNRAEYLEQRRAMMQAWADYLDALRAGADVIPIKRNQA